MTPNLPGWTIALTDDGWVGELQRFPTARQVVCWTDCPTCGVAKGEYCTDGRRVKKTGEMLSLDDWLDMNGMNAPAPSCERRRQRGRSELKKRVNAEKRRLASIEKAVTKVKVARAERQSRSRGPKALRAS